MDTTELASKMLKYDRLYAQLEALEKEICAGVLELRRTQEVGRVHVSYAKGKRTLDWETPGRTASKELIDKYTLHQDAYTVPASDKTDWGAICKEAKLEPKVLAQEPPSAKISIKELEKAQEKPA